MRQALRGAQERRSGANDDTIHASSLKKFVACGCAALILAQTFLFSPVMASADDSGFSGSSSEVSEASETSEALSQRFNIEEATQASKNIEAYSDLLEELTQDETTESDLSSDVDIADAASLSDLSDNQDSIAQTYSNVISTMGYMSTTVSFTNNQSEARNLLSSLNSLRRDVGASNLIWDGNLEKAAQQRAAEISLLFDHTRPNGTSVSTVGTEYNCIINGENIAFGTGTLSGSRVLELWKNSSGHYSNMVSTSFKSVGMASVTVNGATYWVQLFSSSSGNSTYSSIGTSASIQVIYGDQIQYNGSNRYETAVGIAEQNFTRPTSVVIATGGDYADALSASSLAGMLDNGDGVPILLTASASLPDCVRQYIASNSSISNVYIVGGTSAVSTQVQNQLASLVGTNYVHRINGDNRYETAIAVDKFCLENLAGGYLPIVILAYGYNFPDAVSASPLAYMGYVPVLLCGNTVEASSETLEFILQNHEYVIIVGGDAAVSEDIQTVLETTPSNIVGGIRVYGDDRYETSALMAMFTTELLPDYFNWNSIAFATGTDYPDALTGAGLCAKTGSPLILVSDNKTSAFTEALSTMLSDYYGAGYSYVDTVYYLGGDSAISTTTQSQIRQGLNWIYGSFAVQRIF